MGECSALPAFSRPHPTPAFLNIQHPKNSKKIFSKNLLTHIHHDDTIMALHEEPPT